MQQQLIKVVSTITKTESSTRRDRPPPKSLMISRLFIPLLVLLFSINSTTLFSQLHPMFPVGVTNASVSCQLRFFSEYPADDLPDGRRVSPYAFDQKGQPIAPCFYVIPTIHLHEALHDNSAIRRYAVQSTLFFDDETNVIIIAPNQAFSYNTSYSVVFDNFPLLMPNIHNNNGYIAITVNDVFEDYITTITAPLSITSVSFEKTGNVVWNLNEDIVINFSKPINPKLEILDSIWTLIKVGEATNSGQGLSYDFITIPTLAELSEDKMSVTVKPTVPFEAGASYFLNVNWEKYLGDDFFNTSYGFRTPDRIIADIKVHFPNGNLPGEFKYKGYDGQKLYYYGDTIRLGFPAIYQDYYLSEWRLPETTEGTLYNYGEQLEIILDSDNYFSNAHANPAFNGIKRTGITIDVYYSENPIDILHFSSDIADSLVTQFPNFLANLTVEGIEEKLNDSTYTVKRYTVNPIDISFYSAAGLTATFTTPANTTSIGSTTIPANNYFAASAVSTALRPFEPGGWDPIHNGGNIVIKIDPPDPPHDCKAGIFTVKIHYEGDDDGRSMENWEFTNITDMIEVYFTDWTNRRHFPVFEDSLGGEMQKISNDTLILDPSRLLTDPVKVRYNVKLLNPDYEIFLISTKHGPGRCTVDGDIVRRAKSGWYYYGDNQRIPHGVNAWNNYELTGASAVSGELRTRNYKACENTLEIYVRRKIVEFALDVVNPTDNRTPNIEHFKLAFEDAAPPYFRPVLTWGSGGGASFRIPSKTNFPDTTWRNGIQILDSSWSVFIGKDGRADEWHDIMKRRVVKKLPSNGRENVIKERVSVFYYSGESFKYRPFVQEGSGYKFLEMTFPENSDYSCESGNCDPNNPKQRVTVENFREKDKVEFQSGEGFRLKYIEVQKPNSRGSGRNYFTYAVHSTDVTVETPLWQDKFLEDVDDGVGMLTIADIERGDMIPSGQSYGDKITRLFLIFSKPPDSTSFANNVKIEDRHYRMTKLNRSILDSARRGLIPVAYNLRADSNRTAEYPIKITKNQPSGLESIGPYSEKNTEIRGETVEIQLINWEWGQTINRGMYHAICHLQPFGITITNTDSEPFMSRDGERLVALPRDGIFNSITVPPGVSIKNESSTNLCFGEVKRWGAIIDSWGPLRPIINFFKVEDREGYKFDFTEQIASLTKYDEDGNLVYEIDTRRLAAPGVDLSQWHSINYNLYEPPETSRYNLNSKQRIIHVYDLTHAYRPGGNGVRMCEMLQSTLLNDLNKDKENSIVGRLISGLFGTDNNLGGIVVSTMASLVSKFGCNNDDNTHLGSIYALFANTPALDFIESNPQLNFQGEPQDWSLWGVGEHGMYMRKQRETFIFGFTWTSGISSTGQNILVPIYAPFFRVRLTVTSLGGNQ